MVVLSSYCDFWADSSSARMRKVDGEDEKAWLAVVEGQVTRKLGIPEKRVIACIGDGSFQVTARDVSTMLRCGQRN
ncbi:hypothetical protein K1719_012293 [Acacia pycnantha]|nr:hypothetical protein K1719_036602 [Acacia pycnantha]KAI9116635.1 hypothetical protein K1719_012293 [Acacia pycnantha]